jgi:mono/diheme cytochrome c family protein
MPRIALLLVTILAAPVAGADLPPAADRPIDFDRDVRPLFVKHCYACHGPEKQKAGLRLDRKADALKGGDDGAVIVAGKGADSPLVKFTAGLEADRVMPPKGERLTAEQIGVLRAWVDQGAKWPDAAEAEDPRDWWSFRPLAKPLPPKLSPEDEARARNPVDRFILAKLREKGLAPSPEADRRALIRRLYFDLIGLPPAPEDVAAFVQDPAPDAYERLVDRLLASPHYGERWARHWLDVVHYGDTHGYDKDQPRPNAWPYRDYVIRSFNADKPYSRFVQEQVAGDALFPDTADGMTALGFIAAGPWDLIGHAEVPETKIDGKIARHLDRDDMVANTINTFVGLTIQCAQCHNHKFDPIRQEDYYRLQAVFAALDRADRPYHTDAASAKRYRMLSDRRSELRTRQRALDEKVKAAAGRALVELDEKIAATGQPATKPEFGYHSGLSAKQDVTKWVQVDLGASSALDRIVLWGCHDDFNNIGAGFGFPVRFKIEVSDDAAFAANVTVISDRSTADVPNPGVAPQVFPAKGAKGRYVRVTATKLAPRQNDFNFALAELEAFDAADKNVAAGAAVTALDSIEAPVRWRKSNLTDGYAPGRGAAGDLAKLRTEREELIARVTDAATVGAIADITTALTKVEAELAKVPPTGVVYAGTVYNGGSATFRGTGPDGGRPRPIFVLKRGDVKSPLQEVGPGTVNVLRNLPGSFDLSPQAPEGDRRAALARWLTDPKNPLTWRSIVNRVWQYHFGRGIVATPNDLGKMGQLPSHPELLDWLAAEFRDGGQSLKALHRLLVTSAAYRQVSVGDERFDKLDAGNVYLWRMSRRKLEAESVRDAALAVAGKLDRRLYGPAFRDFVMTHPEHSPHYEYELYDPDNPQSHRRSVYRFLVRSKPQPFMTVLDCADPSMQVEKRTETLSPLQALALFNNGFMLAMAKHLAERAGSVETAFRLALARAPTADERRALEGYAKEHGLANACRVILNLNEFVFVD